MPINKRGGKKGKKAANKKVNVPKRLDPKSDESEIYGRVLKKLGSGRFIVMCTDNVERNCRVAGRLYKRGWIDAIGTIVLVQLHPELGAEYTDSREDKKGTIIAVYTDSEKDRLVSMQEFTREFSIGSTHTNEEMDFDTDIIGDGTELNYDDI